MAINIATIFDDTLFSVRNAEIMFISIVGGAAGNAMYSWATTEADWIGEHRAEMGALTLAILSGLILWGNRQKL
jgi:hypothetical protein